MSAKHLVLTIELPSVYTDDIEGLLAEYKGDFDSESECILNIVGEPSIVRVRLEIAGEKDSTVEEVWGSVREATLVEPSRGYGDGPHLTEDQLAEHGGHRLMHDERSCEWCELREPAS